MAPSKAAHIDELMDRAMRYFQNRAWVDALTCFDQLAAECTNSAEIHNYHARVFEGLERYAEALECLNRALALQPTNFADLRNRAIVLKKLGRLPEALLSGEAALAVRPDDRDMQVEQALLLNELDRREEALACIERTVAQSPNDLDALMARRLERDQLAGDRQQLSDGVSALQKNLRDSARAMGSSPLRGSSRMSTRGRCAMACARRIFCRMPLL